MQSLTEYLLTSFTNIDGHFINISTQCSNNLDHLLFNLAQEEDKSLITALKTQVKNNNNLIIALQPNDAISVISKLVNNLHKNILNPKVLLINLKFYKQIVNIPHLYRYFIGTLNEEEIRNSTIVGQCVGLTIITNPEVPFGCIFCLSEKETLGTNFIFQQLEVTENQGVYMARQYSKIEINPLSVWAGFFYDAFFDF